MSNSEMHNWAPRLSSYKRVQVFFFHLTIMITIDATPRIHINDGQTKHMMNTNNACCSCYRTVTGICDTCTDCSRDVCHRCLISDLCKSCHANLTKCTYCGAKLIRKYMEDEIESVFDTCQTGYHCRCRVCSTVDHSETPNECISCDKIIRIEACTDIDDLLCDLCTDCMGFCIYCFCTRNTLSTPSMTCDVCTITPSDIHEHLLPPIASIVMEYIGQLQPIDFVHKRVRVNRGRRTCRMKSILLTSYKKFSET